jgi:alkylation response protein AidB-like acyl-CoA dehydrogenase
MRGEATMTIELARPAGNDPRLLADLRAAVPLIRASAEEAEQNRRLPDRVVVALRDAGAYAMLVPRELGGQPVSVTTFVEALEVVASADGSTGWNLGTSLGCGLAALALSDAGLERVFGRGLDVIFAGTVYRATGHAVAVDGGYRLTGRWPFASGCQHADWLMGVATVSDGASPRLVNGVPERRLFLLSPDDCAILDAWDPAGLRGTGSHDIEVADLWAPDALTAVPQRRPWRDPLFRFPRLPLTALQLSAVATGIARAALDAFDLVAAAKTPTFASRPLREEPTVHEKRARAEALLESARAYRAAVISDVWETIVADSVVSVQQGARLMLTAVGAIEQAQQAVDLVYGLAGTTAIQRTHPLARAFRDIHVAAQSARAVLSYETAGRVLLGLDPPTGLTLT